MGKNWLILFIVVIVIRYCKLTMLLCVADACTIVFGYVPNMSNDGNFVIHFYVFVVILQRRMC